MNSPRAILNKSSKFASSASCTTRKLRLWILLIRLFAALLQNIIRDQRTVLKVDIMLASGRDFARSG